MNNEPVDIDDLAAARTAPRSDAITSRCRSRDSALSGETAALAAEAEAGFDVALVRPKPRARAEVVPVRVPPELKDALEARAEAESTSVSEVVRAALRARSGGKRERQELQAEASLP